MTSGSSTRSIWRVERESEGYPECLRSIPDPPAVLWGLGDPGLLRPGLAVVGSRRASPYGIACARTFAREASGLGIIIVSGGAVGCDAAAHAAALENAGRTVSVLGCGPDVDYPRSSAALLARIREVGCVISEFPPGTQPRRWAFPRRNRIIAGLARAVLVVEAGLPSGTFSTADHALDAGRDVLAVPGSVHAAGSAGTNRLIRQGATPVACAEDLIDSLSPLFPYVVGDGATTKPLFLDLDDPVLTALSASPLSAEELAGHLSRPLREVHRELGRLEIAGVVTRGDDDRFAPSASVLAGDL